MLSDAGGAGFNPATQLGNGFDGLTNGMSFKKVGDYTFIKKLIADGTFLYILTDKKLDRIDLTQGNPGLGQITATTLATAAELAGDAGSLLDCVISGKLALLGTSQGLMRVGNGADISTAASSSAVGWTLVSRAEISGPVTSIVATSVTGRPQDVATQGGGHIYVLSGDRSNDRGYITRYAIADLSAAPIDDNSVVPFSEHFIQDAQTYFINLSEFRDQFATDGALNFHARGRGRSVIANVQLLPRSPEIWLQTGIRFLGAKSFLVPASLEKATTIPHLIHSSASGSWLVGCDSAVLVNE